MRLRDGGESGQATLADLAGLHTIAGKFDEALAEFADVKSWNLSLRYISIRNRQALTTEVRLRTEYRPVLEVLDNTLHRIYNLNNSGITIGNYGKMRESKKRIRRHFNRCLAVRSVLDFRLEQF